MDVDCGHSERKGVLVHSGWYNKILQTGWFMNHRNLFLMVLEAEKSKIKVPARSPSWFIADAVLLCPHVMEGAKELCGVSFIRSLIPLYPHDLISSQRTHLLTPSLFRGGHLRGSEMEGKSGLKGI